MGGRNLGRCNGSLVPVPEPRGHMNGHSQRMTGTGCSLGLRDGMKEARLLGSLHIHSALLCPALNKSASHMVLLKTTAKPLPVPRATFDRNRTMAYHLLREALRKKSH